MRLLHTADWHLGKRLYGLDRRDELRAALEELARIAADEAVDAVVIAGDMIDRRVTDAEPIGDALEAMERFAAVAPVIIVAGNHDDPVLWTALAPYLAMRGVTLLGRPAEPARAITTVATGAGPLHVGMLPWPDPARLGADVGATAQATKATYADMVRDIIALYAEELRQRRMREGGAAILAGHLMVDGALSGGGEREMTMGITYAISPQTLPADLDYIALGHVHRPQAVPRTASPARYSGSPIALDFSEDNHAKTASIVTITPERTTVTEIPLSAGRPLARIRGSLDELGELAAGHPGARFLVEVDLEVPVLDLVRAVREIVPDAIRVEPRYPPAPITTDGEASVDAPIQDLAEAYATWYSTLDRVLPDAQLEAFREALSATEHEAGE